MAETGTQNITEVTEASSIATGDNIYLNHSNQLQQIDYDKLATAILNKLSTQSFSSLETTAKTVLGGINELNSKTVLTAYTPTAPEDNDDISGLDPFAATTRRFGRLVNIQFNIHGTIKTANKFITLFTLNEGYRPISAVIHNYINQGGVPMLLNITVSGEVQVYATSAITEEWIIRQCITFVGEYIL